MLTKDMKFICADIDTQLTYQERIGGYEEKWNLIFSNWRLEDPNGVLIGEMSEVMEREGLKGYRPSDQFKDEPFKSIDELMTREGLSENMVREFLRWRSRRGQAIETEVPTVVAPANDNQHPFFE